jgi:hypothetical protein
MQNKSIDEVLAEHTPALMKLPGVRGTAQGIHAGKECIKVLVERDSPRLRMRIPDRLEGYPVEVEVTGRFDSRSDTK